jgi:hypothetical protein
VCDESGTHSVSGRDINEVSSMENSTLSARKLQLETVPTYNEQRLVREVTVRIMVLNNISFIS